VSSLYRRVADRAGHRCEYCRAPEAIFNLPFKIEHIIPVSRDGLDEESNRALACRACNLYKSNHLAGDDEVAGESVRLYHPRQDRWHEHFRVDEASGTIVGLTPIARATVSVLQMNRANQLAARQRWMLLGLYP
jgi:HNH endonuclease